MLPARCLKVCPGLSALFASASLAMLSFVFINQKAHADDRDPRDHFDRQAWEQLDDSFRDRIADRRMDADRLERPRRAEADNPPARDRRSDDRPIARDDR